MKIKFTAPCVDKNTGDNYRKGMIKEFPDERAKEIIATGYARETVETVETVDIDADIESAKAEKPVETVETVDNFKEELEAATDELAETVENTGVELVNIFDMTLEELKKCAKDIGVSVRGTKKEIIDRILEAEKAIIDNDSDDDSDE